MGRCNRCGKHGLFLRLRGGLCDDCQYEIRKKSLTQKCKEPISPAIEHNDLDLAEQIMNSLKLGGEVSQSYKKEVTEITLRLVKQGAIAAHAASLCGEPTTPKGYYIKAMACSWAGASYRPEVIKWATKWIESGCFYPEINSFSYLGCTPSQSRFTAAYEMLGQAYEGEYMFDEAIAAYKKAWDYRPNGFHLLNFISRVLTKKNQIDEAIKLLQETPLMEGETKSMRSSHIKELKEKKAKGYVYRPRKRKSGE